MTEQEEDSQTQKQVKIQIEDNMSLTALIPKIFYSDVKIGLKFFTEGLGFILTYQQPDEQLYIVKRDAVTILLFENDEYAKRDRPEIRIATDDITSYYNEIKERASHYLHPNLNVIKRQPWGLKEFALLDETTVCVIIQQE